MYEKCPLQPGQLAVDKFPDVCQRQCEKYWDQAITQGVKDDDYDVYGGEHAETCNSNLEHSHMGLHAHKTDDGEFNRTISLVDECGHGVEFGEQGYLFNCPHSGDAAL